MIYTTRDIQKVVGETCLLVFEIVVNVTTNFIVKPKASICLQRKCH